MAMERRDFILETVRRTAADRLAGLHTKIYLFGSWARHQERVSSDIDLAIWYDRPLPPGTLAGLRDAYEESTLPFRVDVVDLTETDEHFREIVLREGVEWNV